MFRGVNLKSNLPILGLGAVLGGIFVFTATSAVGCGKGGDIVAQVNGEPITKEEFMKYLELKPQVRVQTQNGPANLPVDGFLGMQAMQDMIAQQVTLQLAIDKKMEPTPADIQKELDFREKLQKNFLVTLTERGLSLPMIRKSIKIDLIQEKLLTESITVSDAEVTKFIAENKDRFKEPARAELYWVLVYDDPTKKKVDESLQTLNFQQVAARYSKDPNAKKENGRLRDANSGADPSLEGFAPDIKAKLTAAPEGGVTDWIRVQTGWAKFLVKQKYAEKAITPNPTQREAIRRELGKNKGAAARNIDNMILEKLLKSDIKVQVPAYTEPWKKILETYKEEGKMQSMTGARN